MYEKFDNVYGIGTQTLILDSITTRITDPGLMSRKPRPTSEEILTPELLLRYFTAGLYIGIACVGIYASYFIDNGIALQDLRSWSTCADPSSCIIYADLAYPQTLALTTLVTTELLKALCTVSTQSSIFKVTPLQNPWLLIGVAVPFGLNLAIIYTPALENSFGLVPNYEDITVNHKTSEMV